jgi:membrane-associated protease RseP (regulator of RpoE activity)
MVIASTAVARGNQNSDQAQKQDQQQATASRNEAQSAQQTFETAQSQQQDQQTSQKQASQKQASQQDRLQTSQQAGKTAESKHANGKQGGHLGVSILTDKTDNGVLVVQIRPNTAAQKMGLQRRDRITELNGEKVKSADGFISDISSMNPGDKVELKVVRDGHERTIRGELEGYSESVVETQGPSGSHEYRQFQSYIDPNQRNAAQASRDQNLDQQHQGTQASYENRGEANPSTNGELESRVSKLETQIEHMAQQLDQLVTNSNQGQTASSKNNPSSNTKTK